MRIHCFLLPPLLLALALIPAASGAGAGKSLLSADPFSAAALSAEKGVASASMKIVDANQPEFKKACQITVSSTSKMDRAVQLKIPAQGAINLKDVLFVEFWARRISSSDESGDARGSILVEQKTEPYEKAFAAYPWSAGAEWRHITLPIRATGKIADGEVVVSFRLGAVVQTVEIAGLALSDGGETFDISKLPPPIAVTYPGREPAAAWRKAAAERIEKYRKAPLRVSVVDEQGKPVAGATVSIKLVRHAFGFSSAIGAKELLASETAIKGTDRYREMIPQLFSRVTLENDLKWEGWEANREQTLRALEWTQAHGYAVRGHNLVWPSWRRMPADLKAMSHDPAALRKRIMDHATDVLTATGDKVGDWDVVNEPQSNHDLMDACGGDGIILDLFQLAKKLHPKGNLYLNEALNFSTTDKLQRLGTMATDWRKRGAPVDGLGLQCHYAWTLSPPEEIVRDLERLAPLGFALQITEFDIDLTDEQLQADYLRDFFTAVFSEPAVNNIQMWGFWEGRDWRPNAALWRKDWTIKPSGQAYLDLMKQWRTDATLVTDAAGKVETRGFLGDYEVSVTGARGSGKQSFTLAKDGDSFVVKLGAGR